MPALTGAPCVTNDNCPAGQFCGADAKCALANTGTGGGAGGGVGGGAGGGSGGGAGGGGGNACGADLATDPNNCGTCDNVCPTPVNAVQSCVAGACSRGPCAAGFFDLDGTATFGCESTCVGKTCTFPDGGSVTVTNDPLPETGLMGRAFVNGSSLGSNMQANATHTNLGSIGEATPAVDGGIEVSNSTHRHRGGFGARAK